MKARILLVEDEADLRSLVEYNLRTAGHDVESVGTGFAALQALAKRTPDLVVLDLMLPDLPGTHICREIREGAETRAVPVLMLTAKGDDRDKVTGLELGADDYVVKPVSMRELVLRVAALLRRTPGARTPGARSAPATRGSERAASAASLEVGALAIDREAHAAWSGGWEVELTPLEFRLLETMLERAGRVQTRESLLEDVWGVHGDLETRTVDTHVKRLRAKLGEAGEAIETVRGIGYRLRKDD